MKESFIAIFAISTFASCSTLTQSQKRMALYSGIGAGGGALAGAAFSPNQESRALNALVFGLTGALAGSLIASFGPSNHERPSSTNLQDRLNENRTQEFMVYPKSDLPDFLQNRIQPVIVEEFVEKDLVSEDGSLHEPHKVYRIRQAAELFARPASEGNRMPAPLRKESK